MERAIFKTISGSVYEIKHDDQGWWVRGKNVVTSHSAGLGDRWWPINPPQPWPPEVGNTMYFSSYYVLEAHDHPDRMHGGGKNTSVVESVTEVQGNPD